ncbi:MAG: hypothetical protein GXP35_01260 [Actinobacteria bacterium]|nr:hypothetical protein [Actinomycetota bacterium]
MQPDSKRRSQQRRLVIGASGYVGREIMASSFCAGIDAVGAVRTASATSADHVALASAADLDELLAAQHFDQIVTLPQLSLADIDWILDRIDGDRWLVFSSAQLGSNIDAPGSEISKVRERLAVVRGAVVLRPTMIYGRGGDGNISRTIRQLHRTRVPIQVGDGAQLVQPIHVDDVTALVDAHLQIASAGLLDARCGTRAAGRTFPVGGPEAVPTRELMVMLSELLGLRVPPLTVRSSWLDRAASVAPLFRLRSDQIRRLLEDKTIDDGGTKETFGWEPTALAHRLEQAVAEALGVLVS